MKHTSPPIPSSVDADVLALLEMNPAPVIRADLSGRILLGNAAARSTFNRASLGGEDWLTLIGATQPFWEAVLLGGTVHALEAMIGERVMNFTHHLAPDGQSVLVFGSDVTVLRTAEESLRTSERMATLGTLSAGVAHELNNPAAAVARGAEQLRDAMVRLDEAFVPLSRVCQRADRLSSLGALTIDVRARAERHVDMDPLTRADREADIEQWLEPLGLDDPWELAAALVNLDMHRGDLDHIRAEWDGDTATVVRWMARAQPVYSLVKEIGEASSRISEIVKALKTYSYLGKAAVREVVVSEGLDSTLVMLRGKLKSGIRVTRHYDPSAPPVPGYGSELNQVWTNLIDNAADAIGGSGDGELIVRTRADGDWVVVEIQDNGPGIPEQVRSRIFDPFFTTKAVGHGTGLGLATARSIIVQRHRGSIEVTSRPGCTRFTVRLPVRLDADAERDGASADGDTRDRGAALQ